ncbi:Double-stranded RNA-binding 2 -like protein [Gossypium arboreum]|uniref:Double-stranded RNA-binding 2-like protein n=1 Tax=Gossypium arboreum TaxID=29729 RepID=A0A0B0PU65_GOSAR|nr:Double-stranded RNA-binding 2 -like protein [Gossypium arboreum]
MYKSKLQELCQQRRWALPRYTSMKDGPDHNPFFKASVFVNNKLFNSSVPCKSCKEAQSDAAKSAFLYFGSYSYSLAATAGNPNPVGEVDLGFYKNLLQELTQREEWNLPEYKTEKCGVPHRPTFFSSVEVGEDVFYGEGGKSKKEAEINAAKVAYTNLTERLQVSSSELCSPQYLTSEHLKVTSTSVLVTFMENEENETGGKELAKSTTSNENSASCSRFVACAMFTCTHVSVWIRILSDIGIQGEPLKSLSSADLTTAVEIEEDAEEIDVQEAYTQGKEGSTCSESTHVDISGLSISHSNMEKDKGFTSYFLNNRFRVYRCFPSIAFPQGITVLPISEDKWVAVSLEFPNERDD